MKSKTERDFMFESADESPGFLLWQASNFWQREIKKALLALNLTHAQFVLLATTHWFAQQRIAVTQKLLSDRTQVDPMTTSIVLRTLQKKGLISRMEHTTDTRAKTVVLSEQGKRVTRQAIKIVEAFDVEFFGVLSGSADKFNRQLKLLILR